VRQRQKETKGIRRPRPIEKEGGFDLSGPAQASA
jgi:hypothetical protein